MKVTVYRAVREPEYGDAVDSWEDKVVEFDPAIDEWEEDILPWFRWNMGGAEPSIYPFQPGAWYSYTCDNYRTGDMEETTFHLDGFTPEQETEIYHKAIK